MGEDDIVTSRWAALLAEGEASKTGSIGPGLIAFVVVMLLVVATIFLMRSMVKQIKKIPPSFDDAAGAGAPPGDAAGPQTKPGDPAPSDAEPDGPR